MQDPALPSRGDWTVKEQPDQDDVRRLREHLGAYNMDRAGIHQGLHLAVFLRDASRQMVAGIYGWLWGACLELDYLWVHEDLRGQGIGAHLVQTLEEAAAARGCCRITLDTFSFQAPGFYLKLGYEVFAVVGGYGDGYQKLYFQKRLV